MKLYDTSLPHQSLIHEIWYLCDADINSYPLKDVLRRINAAIEELVGKILMADGTWQFDDSNYTNLPIGTQTLINGQAAYNFNDKFLQLEEVKIKDTAGIYRRIKPLDPSELSVSVEEWFGTTSGMPTHYDKVSDDTIKLYPSPSSTYVTLASGLKIHYKRTAKLYTMSNSTTITSGEESVEPGIPSPFHILIAHKSSLPYNEIYHPKRVAIQQLKINTMTEDLLNFFSQKEKDKRKQVTMKGIKFR